MTGHFGRSALLSLVIAVACTSAWAGSTVYRWKDSGGNTVHSDRPPPTGTQYDTINTNASFNHTVDGDAATPSEQDEKSDTSGQAEATGEAGKSAAEKNTAYCDSARQNLDTLESAARIRIMDDSGEYRYLDEEEKDIERGKARSIIEAHCEE